MDEQKVAFKDQLLAFLVCGIVFSTVYHFADNYASSLHNVPSFVFAFEQFVPFIPISIIPYMSSGLCFVLVFFATKTKKEVLVLSKRMLFIIVVSGICFVLFPLQYSVQKPYVASVFLKPFFNYLETWDTAFNQMPSLHISFVCIYWWVFIPKLKGVTRLMVAIWLILIAISTLTVYQHHFIDIVAALVLVAITFYLFPFHKNNTIKRAKQKIH